MHGTAITWNDDNEKKFKDTLLLSKAAKKYGIAQNIMNLQIIPISFKTIHAAFFTYIAAAMIESFSLNKNTNLLFVKMTNVLLCVILFILWLVIIDITSNINETDHDKELGELGDEYIKGGIEYCEKLLERNKVIRDLMGKNGESIYTESGDYNVSLNNNIIFISKNLNNIAN